MGGNKRGSKKGAASGVEKPIKKQRRAAPGGVKTVRGMSSARIFHQILRGDVEVEEDSLDLVELAIKYHRIKAVRKSGGQRTVFNAQTGHHEWIPTDCMSRIVADHDPVWTPLFYTLRSPTWLLILNPRSYCADASGYNTAMARAVQRAKGEDVAPVKASELGLVGHSGGLGYKGTQQTTHQSTWHDSLRALFELHREDKSYQAYFVQLRAFIETNFLFVSDREMPGAAGPGASAVLKQIEWDLDLSYSRPDAYDKAGKTLADVAADLNAHWAVWMGCLENSFRAQVPMGAAPVAADGASAVAGASPGAAAGAGAPPATSTS